mgnify:FL=1
MNYKDFEKQAEEIGVGNRCIVSIEGTVITDAKLQKENGNWFICQNVRKGVDCADKLGYKYSWAVYNDISASEIGYLKPYEVKYKEGDVLVDLDGNKRMVLGVCGGVHLMSDCDDFKTYDNGFTKEELDELGYKLFQEEEKKDTVKFGGKVYDKKEFEKRIEALKEVEV